MKVVIAGEEVGLGVTEVSPTIGITDFSRRETDDFGVTTVVPRGFARRMSVRFALPFDEVDGLQQRLAGLRATPTRWIADDRFAWLNFEGFYKDFNLDLALPPTSFCTLTVEGLAETEAVADTGGDPAPEGRASSLQLLQPVAITDPTLVSSSVPETDYPEWAAGSTYPLGARVIRVATHRVYESAAADNIGNVPDGPSGKWFDIGPTNRWAMFDQALGTSTSAAGAILTTLLVSSVNAVALLDLVADHVRVQAEGYDRIIAVGAGATTFLDLPLTTGEIAVTISGTGTVSVGTLLAGRVVPLGVTEASPTAGINDFSRKEVDDFGEVTVVERAWAKRMTTRALIRTDAIDLVANRIASVRARPSLWLGDAEVDSLTVYGFFRDFGIEVGENVSTLSLSIEGISKAAPPAPYVPPTYSDGTPIDDLRPAQPGATNGADPNSPLGPDGTVGDTLQTIEQAKSDIVALFATYGDTASAAASATAAAASASAAQGYRDTAQAAASNAAAASSQAVTAKTAAEDAAGLALSSANAADASASTATAQAGVASSAAAQAAATARFLRPTTFEQDGLYFSGDALLTAPLHNVAFTTTYGVRCANNTDPNAYGVLGWKEPVAFKPGHYRVRARVGDENGVGDGVQLRIGAYEPGNPARQAVWMMADKPVPADGFAWVEATADLTATSGANITIRPEIVLHYGSHVIGPANVRCAVLEMLDVTAEVTAALSASAAAGSASTASSKATEAGQSASAASASATTATTKASEAATSASQASVSEESASGSASSAASSASVAAVARDSARLAAQALLPDNFTDPANWVNDGTWGGTASVSGGIAHLSNGGSIRATGMRPLATAATYRVTSDYRVINQGGGVTYLGVGVFDTDRNRLGEQWSSASDVPSPPLNQWRTDRGTTTTASIRSSFPTAAFISPLALVGYYGVSDGQIRLLRLDDITSETSAATSASAASNSASSAAASSTTAGQQAGAAQQSATNAATSASNAATSASNASTSETNAAGSAATASSAASNAANSATQAGGSASAAAGSASTAGTHATNAGNSASASAASEVSAASARDSARLAAKSTIPENFTDPSNWTNAGSWGGTSSIAGGVMRTYNGGSFMGTFRMPLTAGATYREIARHRVVNQGGGVTYIGVNVWNAAGGDLGAIWSSAAAIPSGPLNQWITTIGTITAEAILWQFPTGAFISPLGLFGYNGISDAEVTQLRLQDVTSEVGAVGAASAAASSASSAATSSGQAGLSAAAAQFAATAANVSEGNAASSASSASGSASSANNAAASAANSVSTAASHASAAAGSASGAASSATTATAQASIATAQAAAAQQSSETAARVVRAGVVPNPVFSAPGWAPYPAYAAPPGWSVSVNDGSPYYGQTQGVTNIYSGGPAFQLERNNGGRGSYVTQGVPPFVMNGWWVIECAVTLEDGDAKGAGLLFQYGDPYNAVAIDFWVDPRADGTGANSQKGTTSSQGRPVQHFAKMFQVTGFPNPPANYHNLHMMAGWEVFDQGAYRGFLRTIWHMVNIRAATPEEIRTRTVLPALEATVATHSGVLANLEGRTEAFLEQIASTGGAAAKVRLRASNGAGGTTSSVEMEAEVISLAGASGGLKVVGGNVEISGRLNVVGGVVVSPDGKTSMDLNQNRIVFDNGTFMKVTGVGFGTSNQFIEWFGPKMALNLCTEANGTSWLKLDGSGYFGGSLSAGTLKNAVSTTSHATDANVTTGSFGSNGGPRVVTLSYSYSSQQQITGACPATPTFGATVDLYRGTDATGVYLTTLTINSGNWACTPGAGEFEPGGWTASMGGSLTYTDNSGGAVSSYFVRLTSRTAPAGDSLFQAISLVSIEQ